MNKFIISGNLGRDPELTVNGDKQYCRFTVAVRRNYKNAEGKYDADWFNCTAFGKTAENINKFFHKGSQIIVEGHVQTGTYTKNDGTTGYSTNVLVEAFDFCGSNNGGGNTNSSDEAPAGGIDGFMNIPEGVEESLPFN